MGPFLEHIRNGSSISASALAAGVGRTTVYRTLESDQAFADQLKDAWEHGTDLVEDLLLQDAQKPGAFTPKLAILRARRPEKYREHFEVEHKGRVLIWDLPGPKQIPSKPSDGPSAAGAPG